MTTKERLERQARHWPGISLNDQIDGREPTPMITVEMRVTEWDAIWAKDPLPELYEALEMASTTIFNAIRGTEGGYREMLQQQSRQINEVLSKTDKEE